VSVLPISLYLNAHDSLLYAYRRLYTYRYLYILCTSCVDNNILRKTLFDSRILSLQFLSGEIITIRPLFVFYSLPPGWMLLYSCSAWRTKRASTPCTDITRKWHTTETRPKYRSSWSAHRVSTHIHIAVFDDKHKYCIMLFCTRVTSCGMRNYCCRHTVSSVAVNEKAVFERIDVASSAFSRHGGERVHIILYKSVSEKNVLRRDFFIR